MFWFRNEETSLRFCCMQKSLKGLAYNLKNRPSLMASVKKLPAHWISAWKRNKMKLRRHWKHSLRQLRKRRHKFVSLKAGRAVSLHQDKRWTGMDLEGGNLPPGPHQEFKNKTLLERGIQSSVSSWRRPFHLGTNLYTITFLRFS